MAPQRKYNIEEERIGAHKEAQQKYLMKQYECQICDCVIKQKNKNRHQNSSKHNYHANRLQRCDNKYLASDRHLTNNEL